MLNMSDREIELNVRFTREYLLLRGFQAYYHQLSSQVDDHENDPGVLLREPITLRVVFEDYPNRKVLKSIGWFSEDDRAASLPILAYLPRKWRWGSKDYVLEPRRNERLDIEFRTVRDEETRSFTIEEVYSSGLMLMYWVVRLSPLRERIPVILNDAQNESYLSAE
jgi:hypothetical protein